ncbi:MAG: ABC transporter ATP-binding protein [Ralstonia sp.]|uniref:ABC transporter ATP-binding protein n=2 Tax=Ralstonia pickettii TaxID=329 RepID=A0A2P4RFB4_RALPI|nr:MULTISPECIES: ABC transporter ATP-binding protein [Ralstonia]MBA4015295.1 spermidine/putrescine ABC transporter ATP-binding protein PotA [Ralstonia sp.]MBA4203151.1 spermidine/putrescine ABC transporter ATP-binding protein PotA [Ralstonia sp.]MBA4233695.1 spermidine/putrescine ABC transporter ATP-binding protein PotA [Ralstonia sp.]MBA4238726.1 spermidine/putrescine ABC transporter ATP-binding protein PotA [Ralstonia sp.]MBA4280676.1 spermidine/putrescine ABC transporter ATP-binding protein
MILELDQVTAMVGAQTHLYPTSLRLAPGAINVLLGPTQAGKTTLMRIMAGLDRPTTGRVLVDGKDVTGVGVRDRNLAMVYQQFINYPAMTVYDNIASPLRLQGTNKGEIDTRVRAVASKLHIDHLLQRLPAELSGGQQQRCALARALVKRAPLVLLDEPLVNLDYKLREELRAELASLFADGGTTVVYATTEPQEALLLGGHTVVMHEGRVLQDGPTLDMYEVPVSVDAAAIFNDPPMNVLDATVVEGNQIRLPQGIDVAWTRPLPMAAGTRCRIGLRPSHIRLAPRNGGAVALPGTVELAELSGSETYLHVRAHAAGQTSSIGLVAQLPGVHEFELGAALDVFVDPAELFLFDDAGKLVNAPKQGGAHGTH